MISFLIPILLPVGTFYLLQKRVKSRFLLSIIPLIIAIVLAMISPTATRLLPLPALEIFGGIFLFGSMAMAVIVPFPFLMDRFRLKQKESIILLCTIPTVLVLAIPGIICVSGHCNPTILGSLVESFSLAGDMVKTGQMFLMVVNALVVSTGVYGVLLLVDSFFEEGKLTAILVIGVLCVLAFFALPSVLIAFFPVGLFMIFLAIPKKTERILIVILFLVPAVLIDAYVMSLQLPGSIIDGVIFSTLLFGFAMVPAFTICSVEGITGRIEKIIMITSVLTSAAVTAFISVSSKPGASLQSALGTAFEAGRAPPGIPFPDGIIYLAVLILASFIIGCLILLIYRNIIRIVPKLFVHR